MLDELIHLSEQDEAILNRFSLVRDPNQETLDDPTKAPVADFSSGFVGWSIDAIGTYFKERCKKEFPNGRGTHKWSTTVFAVLDERSVQDKTAILATWWATLPENYEEDPDNVEFDYGWHIRRVRFADACHFAAGISVEPGLFLEELNEDEDGVMKRP